MGEQGLTPDLLVTDRDRLARLREYYLDGPPSVAIEITLEETAQQDLGVQRELYERGGVPEYWVIEPEVQRASFWLLGADGRYRQVFPDSDQTYRSAAVSQLALSLPNLWTMDDTDWHQPWLPFMPVTQCDPLPPLSRQSPGELGWDALPFAPRVELHPVRIRFEEYISWCPEAKFEAYDGRMVIGSAEGTRRVMGMPMMTFGLPEVVKLAHPKDWMRFLIG
ncbi:MAG: Uma2 family endonuclease [Chloroflexi bacterium]|nr:Uma2 family endonuclease [Chloroflexota bacterium]